MSDTKVINLEIKRSEPVTVVVSHLRKLLAQAESGDLRGLVYVARCREIWQRGQYGSWPDNYAMIGAAEVLKEEIYRGLRDEFNCLPEENGE